jgi:hypothetical protein
MHQSLPTHITRSAFPHKLRPVPENATSGCFDSSFIALHRVLFCRLLGICLLLRSSRVSIGIGDAYRASIEGVEFTSVGTELSGMKNDVTRFNRTLTHKHTDMVISETGASHACVCASIKQHSGTPSIQTDGPVALRLNFTTADEEP